MKQIHSTNEKVTNQQLLTKVELNICHFHRHGDE